MSTKSKQNEVSSTLGLRIRPRQPAVDTLKAERVQLTAERMQSRLQALPGWQLAPGGKAVNRVRRFPSARVAADFAGIVAHFAAQVGQPVGIELAGKHLTIAVRARNGFGLPESALDFAQALG